MILYKVKLHMAHLVIFSLPSCILHLDHINALDILISQNTLVAPIISNTDVAYRGILGMTPPTQVAFRSRPLRLGECIALVLRVSGTAAALAHRSGNVAEQDSQNGNGRGDNGDGGFDGVPDHELRAVVNVVAVELGEIDRLDDGGDAGSVKELAFSDQGPQVSEGLGTKVR